jgi:hypothetical protein
LDIVRIPVRGDSRKPLKASPFPVL